MRRYKSVFTKENESELVEHIKFLETWIFGFTCERVLELSHQFEDFNDNNDYTKKQKWQAQNGWLAGFRLKNSDISSRKPEATSATKPKPSINRK